jgi:hypothetical protein
MSYFVDIELAGSPRADESSPGYGSPRAWSKASEMSLKAGAPGDLKYF